VNKRNINHRKAKRDRRRASTGCGRGGAAGTSATVDIAAVARCGSGLSRTGSVSETNRTTPEGEEEERGEETTSKEKHAAPRTRCK
jgi:hypothetical protein